MRRLFFGLILILILSQQVCAAEYLVPEVPQEGQAWMPETESFGEGMLQLLEKAVAAIRPDLLEASRVSIQIISTVLLLGIVQSVSGSAPVAVDLVGVVAIATILLHNTNSLIRLGTDTITQMSEYGRLLLPVMTAAYAAQGAVTASAALYAGTALFSSVLTGLLSSWLNPLVYLYLALGASYCASGEEILKRMRDGIRGAVSWFLKIFLTAFTTYMSITGVVSGTTDAATLKATKVTISSVVPVVGSILSDASEAILVSAGLAKNAAGIYGIFAVLALFLDPFLKIGAHYLILKATSGLCSVFGTKKITDLTESFSSAMGILLAMTGAVCLLQLISTVCFLRGVGQ